MPNINLMQIGTVLVFIGMILVIIGAFKTAKTGGAETKVAVGGFLGFIPFGFANDRILMYVLIGLMALAIIIWFVLMYYK